MTTKWIRPIS